MEALDNKCPGCGAKINFNPVNQTWDCDYCGSKFTLEEMQKYSNASSVEVNTEQIQNKTLDKFVTYHCSNCGAKIMADETTVATFCVYCGSTAILKEKIENGRAPDLIIPFKNTKEDASKAFSNVTRYKPLMPKEFRQLKNIEKISGIYIPFWAYDIVCDGNVTFSCTDTSHWSDSKYRYTKVDRYSSTIEGHFDYEKVLADASSRFKDELMDSIEPFDYQELKEYNHAYLAGFFAEKYDVSEDNAYIRAKERTMNTCVELAQGETHHQSSIINNNQFNLVKSSTNYIMLPVWMVNIKYKDKLYTFAMNGQSGKMVGDIPIGIKETIIWGLIIFIVTFLICLLVVLL